MNIKIITCHDVYNYGASLQAYALQTYLKQKGHDVEIIDYLPAYMDKAYSLNFNRYMSIPKMSPLYKYSETRSHTDGFQRNNAKCLDEKGISRFVPHSSI